MSILRGIIILLTIIVFITIYFCLDKNNKKICEVIINLTINTFVGFFLSEIYFIFNEPSNGVFDRYYYLYNYIAIFLISLSIPKIVRIIYDHNRTRRMNKMEGENPVDKKTASQYEAKKNESKDSKFRNFLDDY